MLVLSGHGSGIIGNFLSKEAADRIDSLSVISMAKLIKAINRFIKRNRKAKGEEPREREIDILGLDNCLMSMTEVAYMVHNNASVMIGAEGFEPQAGWPYACVLDAMKKFVKKNPNGGDDKAKELAKRIVCDYIRYYTDYQAAGVSVDQSACDLNQSEELMWAVNSLAEVLLKYLPYDPKSDVSNADPEVRNALVLAHWEAQTYKTEQYTDLYDFCERLQFYCANLGEGKADIRRACQNVRNTIRGSKTEVETLGRPTRN